MHADLMRRKDIDMNMGREAENNIRWVCRWSVDDGYTALIRRRSINCVQFA